MNKARLEAFSDGVIAIIITIMVLELKVPHGNHLEDLLKLSPIFLSYVLSFIFIGIYWNNHHHLIQSIHKVNGSILWANLHLLFWLSLVPFSTGWMGDNASEALPVALYGVILLFAGLAYFILSRTLCAHPENSSVLKGALGSDIKGKLSLVFYTVAIFGAYIHVGFSYILYLVVAMMWIVPDRRFEHFNLNKIS